MGVEKFSGPNRKLPELTITVSHLGEKNLKEDKGKRGGPEALGL